MLKNEKNKGITLIALIVTIIVLLILATVSVQMLTGENGIIKRAMQAKNDTDTAGVLEDLKLKILEYQTKKNVENKNLTLEDYLRSEGIDVLDNDNGTLSVTYNGVSFIIDKTTYLAEVDNRPKFEVAVSEADSNKKVTITVTISNTSWFSSINSVKLTNINKNEVIGEKTDGKSTATFEVDANGDYKVEVKATKNGTQTTGTKLAQVNKIPVTFATTNGTIEIVWLKDTGKTITSTPNEPNLYAGANALQPVYWASNLEGNISGTATTDVVEVKSGDTGYKATNWYNYSANRWANAINTADGSYFVWIPRFAYRIIYWDNTYKNVVGYYDGRGMVDVQGNVIKKTVNSEEITMSLDSSDSGVDKVTKDGIQYIVHPAFDNSVNNGGWSKKVSGFWVAKYEMSREDYDSTLTTTDKWKPHGAADDGGGNTPITDSNKVSIRLVSKPNVTSWKNISIGTSKASTPYATVYANGTSTSSGVSLYKLGKVGDATKEVYNGSGANNWLGDDSHFVYSDNPFFVRGGGYGSGSVAGVFCSGYYGGHAHGSAYSFRVVLGQ